MVYSPTGSFDLILTLGCMLLQLLVLELFHFVFLIVIYGELIPSSLLK